MSYNLYETIAGYHMVGAEKPLYSADQIVGKTLYAKKSVQLKRIAADSAPVVYTVPPGGTVGVVQAYLDVKAGVRSAVYWEFYDANGRSFFAKHDSNAFDKDKLLAQGVLNDKELIDKEKEEAEAEKPFWERWWNNLDETVEQAQQGGKNIITTLETTMKGLIIAGGIYVIYRVASGAVRQNRRKNFRNFYREASRAPRRPRATRTRKS